MPNIDWLRHLKEFGLGILGIGLSTLRKEKSVKKRRCWYREWLDGWDTQAVHDIVQQKNERDIKRWKLKLFIQT